MLPSIGLSMLKIGWYTSPATGLWFAISIPPFDILFDYATLSGIWQPKLMERQSNSARQRHKFRSITAQLFK
jgi:hypothetical protein